MATTVNGAFSEFLSNTVNLYDADTTKARSSRDYLIERMTVVHINRVYDEAGTYAVGG